MNKEKSFALQHLEAWLAGAHARDMGMPKAANPYSWRKRPFLFRTWLAGHRDPHKKRTIYERYFLGF